MGTVKFAEDTEKEAIARRIADVGRSGSMDYGTFGTRVEERTWEMFAEVFDVTDSCDPVNLDYAKFVKNIVRLASTLSTWADNPDPIQLVWYTCPRDPGAGFGYTDWVTGLGLVAPGGRIALYGPDLPMQQSWSYQQLIDYVCRTGCGLQHGPLWISHARSAIRGRGVHNNIYP